jgi:hypothetical protein
LKLNPDWKTVNVMDPRPFFAPKERVCNLPDLERERSPDEFSCQPANLELSERKVRRAGQAGPGITSVNIALSHNVADNEMFLKYESLYLAELLPNNIFPISRATPKPFFRAEQDH